MASMLEQYQQSKVKSNDMSTDMGTSRYIQIKMREDEQIFTRRKFNFNPSARITHLAVANDYLLIGMANDVICRMNLKQIDESDEITLRKYPNHQLANIFLDPLGQHILLTLTQRSATNSVPAELLYLSRKSEKPRASKFRGHEITAVAWNYNNDSIQTTGSILLGTSKGLIFETDIGLDGEKIFASSIEQYWRQVFDIGKGKDIAITGMTFHRVSNTSKYFVIVTTPNRMYQFISNVNLDEKPLLQQVFNPYLQIKESYLEVDDGKITRLGFARLRGDLPQTFVWMTESALYCYELKPYNQPDSRSILKQTNCIKYETISDAKPLDFIITDFHALLMFPDRLQAVCLLNGDVIFEQNYTEMLLRVTRDVNLKNAAIWACTEHKVYVFATNREERNVWRYYCEQGDFKLAKEFAISNPVNYDKVLIKEAEHLFKNEDYTTSARCFAETQSSFEEVCLKFLRVNHFQALKTYLMCRLNKLRAQDKTQITLVVLWLMELYLNQLAVQSETDHIQMEFEEFLALPYVVECVKNNKQTVYDLMASHGDKVNLLHLAEANGDYEKQIQRCIYEKKYYVALDVLKKQAKPALFYQFGAVLFEQIAKATVYALKEMGVAIQPLKILPIFVGCDSDHVHVVETIDYLEFVIFKLGNKDRAIHNYLLTLYVKMPNNPKLSTYLEMQGDDKSLVPYDVYYALKLCRENNLTQPCVQISAMLGLWEKAVELALTIDVELAKEIADKPECVQLRKKLWLMIAKHVVDGKNDIKNAMDFLQQCDLIKIEDILPFFSDFDTIDDFQNAICTSLEEYNQHIRDLKKEMEEASKASEDVRMEIQSFRNRCTIILAEDVCEICQLTLLTRAFYYFPCKHKFHSDCLTAELVPLLDAQTRTKLTLLNQQFSNAIKASDNVSVNSTHMSTRTQINAEIDDIVASECLYCGDYMIRDIDAPFMNDADFMRIVKDWE